MIKSEDIKVSVTFTPGYQERYTAACLRVLEKRKRRSHGLIRGGGLDERNGDANGNAEITG